jgi:hypothetical protein
MSNTTSAIYDVWRAMTRRIKAISFPSVDHVDDSVAVWFGDPSQPQPDEDGNPPMARERVVLVGVIATPDQEWGPIGNKAREESWTFPIFVQTELPGMSSLEALDRMEQLTSAIEADIRTIQVESVTDLHFVPEWFKYERWSIAVEQTVPLVYGADVGYVAQAEVLITCDFRVNKPYRTE